MRVFFKFMLLPTLAVFALAASMAMNFISNPQLLVIFGYICLFVEIFILNISIYNANNAKPIIKLVDYDFEIKDWKNHPPSVCAYVDINNEPKEGSLNDVNSLGVFPTVIWKDENDEVVDKNHGRWFIPNEDQVGAIPLQTVDLDANGLPRRLHFTYNTSQNMVLQSFYRTSDNKIDAKQRGEPRGYYITIFLKDKRTTKAEFHFRITPIDTEAWPHYALRLEQLNGEKGKVIGVKKFDLAVLHNYEKEQGITK